MSAADEWLADVKPARNVGGRPAKNYAARGNRKLECVRCGFHCRTSAAQIRTHEPSCCGVPLTVAHERDQLAVDPETIGAGEARELERVARADIRRMTREANHGFKGGAAQCGVCKRFKSRPADRCDHCGDEPAQFGATDLETRDAERIYNRGAGYAA